MAAAFIAVATTLVPLTAGATGTDTVRQPPNSIGVRLVDVPVDSADDPRALSSVVDHVIPGAAITRRMEIVSTIDEDVEVALGSANAEINDGAFLATSEGDRGFATWVTTDPSSVVVEANGSATASFTIAVPPATPTGEYYGIVFAEPPASTGGIGMRNRVGIRAYLSVGTGDEPPVDFAVGKMTAGRDADGVPFVETTLRNTGGRALDIGGSLSLADGPAGLDAGPYAFNGAVTVLPGEIFPLTIQLDPELPDGPWLAQLRAFSGLLERTAEAEVIFPSEAGASAEPVQPEVTGGTDGDGNDISEQLRQQRRTLLPIAAFLILLAIAMLFLLLWWQRRDKEEDEETSVSAGVAGDDGG